MRALLTGATGLVGSNLCRILRARGDDVVALVRPTADTGALAELGVELAVGDITDAADVLAAASGCDVAVHAAALLGGASQDRAEFEAVNVVGTRNLLNAATMAGVGRVAVLTTTTFFAATDEPLTEDSPVAAAGDHPDDPYTVTKRAAFIEATARAARGEEIVLVVPGGVYGPAPVVERSLVPTSFNRALLSALRGRLTRYVRFPIPWVLAEDVAAGTLLALERGRRGGRYLAMGRPEDAVSTAAFLTRACELAGVDHRVEDVTVTGDDPELERTFGPTLVALGRRRYPVPLFDNARTVAALGYSPTPLDDGLRATIDWLRALGRF